MGCGASTAQPDVADQRNEAVAEPGRPSSTDPGIHGGGADENSESSVTHEPEESQSRLTATDKTALKGLVHAIGATSESAAAGDLQKILVENNQPVLEEKSDIEAKFRVLMYDHSKFLFNFVMTFHLNSTLSGKDKTNAQILQQASKPKLEMRQFKSHTMDNVRVRKMCDEMLALEDPTHEMADDTSKGKLWMRTLQVARGKYINCIKMSNNPDVTIGGYFIISQMLGYIRGLVSLDLSCNELRGAEARVLALGLKYNKSIQDLHLKENSIGTEGATSLADALKVNSTLLFLDLRQNNIRGPGVCVLTDAMNNNKSLTALDLRWNYTGEASDYVEQALLDLQGFCGRNLVLALERLNEEAKPQGIESDNVSVASTFEVSGNGNGIHTASPKNGVSSGDASVSEASGAVSTIAPSISEKQAIIGRLEVTIISAKNLPQVIWTSGKDGEFLGLPQAYCVFQCNQQVEKTAINKKGWNPRWQHSFTVDVASVWNVAAVMVKHSKSLTRMSDREDSIIAMMNVPVGAIINWRGVSKGSDGTWRAYHRPASSTRGAVYHVCKGKDRQGVETDVFDTSELAARAYDDTAAKKDLEKAVLNFSGEEGMIGQHVKEDNFPLVGEDGVEVIGVQAGVNSTVCVRMKYFDLHTNYLEICLEKATSLPKMDAGLGSCDAYCVVMYGDYKYRSRIVRNSLDPPFKQTFRVVLPDQIPDVELKVQVWDWDRFDEDDHMGDATVMVTADGIIGGTLNGGYGVFATAEGGKTSTEYLTNAKGEKSLVHLTFAYFPSSSSGDHAETATATTDAPPLFI